MDDAVLAAGTAVEDVRILAASLVDELDAVELVYAALDRVAARYRLDDAHLVLRPGQLGPQVFRLCRRAPSPGAVTELLSRPTGFYGDPDVVDPDIGAALAGICTAALGAAAARLAAAVDPASGLAPRPVIESALARATTRAGRHGWASTAVLLTTAGGQDPAGRWAALSRALQLSLRAGDEAGVAGPGRALAILGAAGPDVVRPFVARMRVALTAAGDDGVDLLAATASTPDETVDPEEVWRLASERLDHLAGPNPGRATALGAEPQFELELRALPGVVAVGTGTQGASSSGQITVVTLDGSDTLAATIGRRVAEHMATARVRVMAAGATAAGASDRNGPTDRNGLVPPPLPPLPVNGRHGAGTPPAAPWQLAANAPSPAAHPSAGEPRITLLSAGFDPDTGVSEVRLARGGGRGTGRAAAGPLAGGAQATLGALGGLGVEVPFYLVSAERAHTVPGEPVVVVLAPRRHPSDPPDAPLAERIGVAGGSDDAAAAGRATLGALNRYLAGTGPTRTPGE